MRSPRGCVVDSQSMLSRHVLHLNGRTGDCSRQTHAPDPSCFGRTALVINESIVGLPHSSPMLYLDLGRSRCIVPSVQIRNAAITIQSCFRGFKQRLAVTRLNQAAVLIQSHWKGLRQRYFYGRLKWERRADAAATCIQKHARRYLCRASFQRSMQATVCIQSHMRRVLACRRYVAAMSIITSLDPPDVKTCL